MVRTWAWALGDNPELPFLKGTTANSVVVGPTATEAMANVDPTIRQRMSSAYTSVQCLNRGDSAAPEDVADVVGLLCSKDSRLITGSAISACAGAVFIM